MFQTIIILKALAEVALCAFLGQGILYVLAGARRESNFVYTTFKMLTSPVTKFTRFIAPRFIVDQHIGLLAFFLLMVVWLGLIIAKINMVLT
ncbi:MAG: hypothetical protein LH481_10150 [Burkholderiales bacterium]|nr:hypothetical protein [Burkholderiales bacterium]